MGGGSLITFLPNDGKAKHDTKSRSYKGEINKSDIKNYIGQKIPLGLKDKVTEENINMLKAFEKHLITMTSQ